MRRGQKRDLFHLAGWLFADLFVVLMVIFLAATAIVTPASTHGVIPTPTPTLTPHALALKPGSVDLTFSVDVQGLLTDSSTAASQVEQEVNGLLQHKKATHNRAGIVLIFSGGLDTGTDTAVSGKVQQALIALGKSTHRVFTHETVFRDFVDQSEESGMVTLNIYIFA